MTLDIAAARAAFETQIADRLGMPVEEAAFGIFRVRLGAGDRPDPRDHRRARPRPAGLCAARLRRLLSDPGLQLRRRAECEAHYRAYTAAVNCALGLVSADIVHEYSVTTTLPGDTDPATINALYAPMIEKAQAQLAAEGFAESDTALDWSVDLRYARQVHEVTTPSMARRR